MKADPYADMRGRRIKSGWWYCDCPLRWPPTKRLCKRCDIRGPLKGSPVYEMRDSLRMGGHVDCSTLQLVREVRDKGDK